MSDKKTRCTENQIQIKTIRKVFTPSFMHTAKKKNKAAHLDVPVKT
jgi:hypothetical protein